MSAVTWRRQGRVAHAVPDNGWGWALCGRNNANRWPVAADTDSRCEQCEERRRKWADLIDEGKTT